MSDQQLELFSEKTFEELATLTGAYVSENYLPLLRINREAEDDDGNKVPAGSYKVSQDGNTIYGNPVIFRPFMNAYQYMHYDEDENKYINKSIIFKSFGEEAHDELGGLACGKVAAKLLDRLSETERLRQKGIKCYRWLYGLLTMPQAVTATGIATTIQNLPVSWKLSGGNFMAPRTALELITKSKHQFWSRNFICNLQRQKKGTNVYYDAIIEVRLDEFVKFSQSDFETFKLFQETIDKENREVMVKWKKAKQTKIEPSDLMVLKGLELSDEIPF